MTAFTRAQSGAELLEPIKVTLNRTMMDGQPLAVLMNPLTPLQWAAEGRSIPASLSDSAAQPGLMTPDQQEEAAKFMRRIVARAVSHIRGLERPEDDPDGRLRECWIPIKLVESPNPEAETLEISIERFDRSTHITRCWNALMGDLETGTAELQEVDGQRF